MQLAPPVTGGAEPDFDDGGVVLGCDLSVRPEPMPS
jgi:hypothetical protein